MFEVDIVILFNNLRYSMLAGQVLTMWIIKTCTYYDKRNIIEYLKVTNQSLFHVKDFFEVVLSNIICKGKATRSATTTDFFFLQLPLKLADQIPHFPLNFCLFISWTSCHFTPYAILSFYISAVSVCVVTRHFFYFDHFTRHIFVPLHRYTIHASEHENCCANCSTRTFVFSINNIANTDLVLFIFKFTLICTDCRWKTYCYRASKKHIC